MNKLDPQRVNELLADLPQWRLDSQGGLISRQLVFDDFKQAFAFMTEVALIAEKRDHHPDWSNVYNRVDIRLTTYDARGLTQRDFDLARAIDVVFARFATRK